MPILTESQWDDFVCSRPEAHLLQSAAWGETKAAFGWQPARVCAGSTGAQILFRRLPLGFTIAYLPRGPIGLDWAGLWPEVHALCRRMRAIFLKVEPDLWEPDAPAMDRMPGFIPADPIQPRSTVLISLDGGEEDWLARMKQKTRYNIRLAERKGVAVRIAEEKELPLFYRMYAETAVRDGFVIRPEEYYLGVWRTFMQAGMAQPLLAEVEGEPVAGLVLFWFAGRAWYLYGMSRDLHREKMPNYLLQWEAMRLAKAQGCQMYDLWGAPDRFDESDSMWGVFRFKEGLGGTVARTPGAWDFPTRPVLYTLYTRILPRLLDLMRRRGQERIRQEVTG